MPSPLMSPRMNGGLGGTRGDGGLGGKGGGEGKNTLHCSKGNEGKSENKQTSQCTKHNNSLVISSPLTNSSTSGQQVSKNVHLFQPKKEGERKKRECTEKIHTHSLSLVNTMSRMTTKKKPYGSKQSQPDKGFVLSHDPRHESARASKPHCSVKTPPQVSTAILTCSHKAMAQATPLTTWTASEQQSPRIVQLFIDKNAVILSLN